jgi:hypothetical protein
MEGWRDRGMDGWRGGGVEGLRDGRIEGYRVSSLDLQSPLREQHIFLSVELVVYNNLQHNAIYTALHNYRV